MLTTLSVALSCGITSFAEYYFPAKKVNRLVVNSNNKAFTYTYNSKEQLVKSYQDEGYFKTTRTYEYDKRGDIVKFTMTQGSPFTETYSYDKSGTVTLKWNKVADANYYKVEQSTDGKKWKSAKTVEKTSATIKSLKGGTNYKFRVTALNASKKLSANQVPLKV